MSRLTQERLTPEASQRLERYLWQVRTALRGCQSVSADEVERDIREHVDSELPADREISLQELNTVLARLGSPAQWVPQEEFSWWRRFILRLRTGPEDWRLAYLAFGLMVAAGLLLPVFWVFLAASYLAARASIAAAREQKESLGAQKWFVYPQVIAVHTVVLLLVLFVLPYLLASAGSYALYERFDRRWGEHAAPFGILPRERGEFVFAVTPLAVAAWWVIAGIILTNWPKLVQAAIPGACDALGRRVGKVFVYVGSGVLALWAIALFFALS
jgi:hypothetical protein